MLRSTKNSFNFLLAAATLTGCQINLPSAQITANTNVSQNASTVSGQQDVVSASPLPSTQERTSVQGEIAGPDHAFLSDVTVELVSKDPNWRLSDTFQSRDGRFAISEALVGALVEVKVTKSGYKPELDSFFVTKGQVVRINLEPESDYQSPAGPAEIKFNTVEAREFTLQHPDYWTTSSPDPAQAAQGVARLTIGVRTPDGEAEGLFLTIFNGLMDPDAAKANQALSEKLKSDFKATSKSYSEINSEPSTISGQPAFKLEAKLTDQENVESHVLAYSTVYGGRSYILMFTVVPVSRYQTIAPLFAQLAREFKFKELPSSSPNPSASPS